MKLTQCAALLTLITFSAQAKPISENFTDYALGQSVTTGETNFGGIGDGWLSPWRASSAFGTTTSSITMGTPLGSDGNYLSTLVNTAPENDFSAGSLSRAYDATAISSSGTKAFKISFKFRADTESSILKYEVFDSKARAAFYNSSASWVISAHNGHWYASDGSDFVPIAHTFATGTLYNITVIIDPANMTWDLSISDGSPAVTISNLSFRTSTWGTDNATTNARWLIFSASEAVDSTTRGTTGSFSVDSIGIAAMSE